MLGSGGALLIRGGSSRVLKTVKKALRAAFWAKRVKIAADLLTYEN